MTGDQEATQSLWGRVAQEKADSERWRLLSWDTHPVVRSYINRRMTGDPDLAWLPFIKARFCSKTLGVGLSLGCGWGSLERDALRLGICQEFAAFDVSPGAIDVARAEAQKAGLAHRIRYACADLNRMSFPTATYDICFAAASLHHIERLEDVLTQVSASLKDKGLFVLVEYVGPSRYQWTDQVQNLMNRLLSAFPMEQRVNLREPAIFKGEVRRPRIEDVIAADPSEAVRSQEILGMIKTHFNVVHHADYGGTLLQFVLADIAGNFREDNPKDRAILELAILVEESLIDGGVIPSDFVFLVAQKP